MYEPGFISLIIASSIKIGASFPKTRADKKIMSASLAKDFKTSFSCFSQLVGKLLACFPSLLKATFSGISKSITLAPSDLACSNASALISVA